MEEKWDEKQNLLKVCSHLRCLHALARVRSTLGCDCNVLAHPLADHHSDQKIGQPGRVMPRTEGARATQRRGHGSVGASGAGEARGFAAKEEAEKWINMVPVQPQVGHLVSARAALAMPRFRGRLTPARARQTMNVVPKSIDPAIDKRPVHLHGKKAAFFLDW